jgi:hypothetical protein
MFIGRLGPMTMAVAFAIRSNRRKIKIRKPEVVSYQVELLDACNKHELVDFVLRQLHNKRGTGFSNYIKEVTHLVDEVMKPFMEVKKHE